MVTSLWWLMLSGACSHELFVVHCMRHSYAIAAETMIILTNVSLLIQQFRNPSYYWLANFAAGQQPMSDATCYAMQTSSRGSSANPATRVQRFAAAILQYIYSNMQEGQQQTLESVIRYSSNTFTNALTSPLSLPCGLVPC